MSNAHKEEARELATPSPSEQNKQRALDDLLNALAAISDQELIFVANIGEWISVEVE